jgi:hypothetical protein
MPHHYYQVFLLFEEDIYIFQAQPYSQEAIQAAK